MKREYLLAGVHYVTKAAVVDVCRKMLGGVSALDHDFLLDLLRLHPESESKIGCGVRRFFIHSDGFGGACFWLERTDSSRTDWSFLSCLKPPTHEQQVRSAMRRAIADQAIAFVAAAFAGRDAVPCEITGAPVTRADAHVDHRPPRTFLCLVTWFLGQQGLAYADVGVMPTTDGSTATELSDPALIAAWKAWHKTHATLQITSSKANLSQGGGR